MFRTGAIAALAAALFGFFVLAAAATPPVPGAKVYFINLKNGATLKSPFLVRFGLSGMGVAPAGVDKPETGHHHLLVDTTLSGEALTQPIPSDAQHIHYGKGQTEAMVSLPPGKHTLQLVLGDWSHIPFDPPLMSARITITVK